MPARISIVLALIAVVALIATGADQAIAQRLQFIDPQLRHVAALVTRIGDSTPYLLASALAAIAYRQIWREEARWRAAAFVFVGLAASGALVNLLKVLLGRIRPGGPHELGIGNFIGPTLEGFARSFPSGHAATMGALVALVSLMAPRWQAPAIALAALVGVSRLLVGYHFASDVIAGLLVGWIAVTMVQRLFARRGWWAARGCAVSPGPMR